MYSVVFNVVMVCILWYFGVTDTVSIRNALCTVAYKYNI